MRRTNTTIKSILFAFILVTLSALISCKNDDDAVEEPEEVEQVIDNVVVPSTTKILTTQQANVSVKSMQSNGSLLLVKNDDTEALKTNDVLILGVTETTPLGLFKKITSITESNGDLVVSTRDATLEEAIKEGIFNSSIEIGIDDIDSMSLAEGVTMGRTEGRTENSIPIQIDTQLAGTARLSGSVSFTPKVDFNLEISGFSIEEASIDASIETTSQLNLSSALSGGINVEKTIARFYLKPIPVKFLVFFPRLTIKVNSSGEINVGIEAMAQRSIVVNGKLTYNENGWTPTSGIQDTYIIQPLTPVGNASAELSLNPSIELLLFGIAGPSFNPEAWLKYDIDIQRDPCWLVEAGLRGNIGISLNTFSSSLSANTENLEFQRKEVAKSTVSCLDPGFIEGRVQDAISNTAIAGVNIEVKKEGNVVASGVSGTDGTYQISITEGEGYSIDFSKDGFLPITRSNVTVVANATTFIEATLQIDEQFSGLGNIGGRVTNALTGIGESGVNLDIRFGLGNISSEILQSTTTGSSGFYEMTNLEAGNYTIEASKAGFRSTFFSVIVIGQQTTGQQNGTIAPESSGLVRIVLTWGANPSDLDSHLTGPNESGGRFHVYYSNQFPPGSNANLDVDDVSSFGPETITISVLSSGTYRYSIHDFTNRNNTGSIALAQSQAKVTVLNDEGIRDFFVPTSAGTLWTVFEIREGVVVPINSMGFESNPSNVSRSSAEGDASLIYDATRKHPKK